LDFVIIIWVSSRRNHAFGTISLKMRRKFACSIVGRASLSSALRANGHDRSAAKQGDEIHGV
jgi:hypothetical protein